MKTNLIFLFIIVVLSSACGEDRYPCDENIQRFAPPQDSNEGGYVPPDCKSISTNGETQ